MRKAFPTIRTISALLLLIYSAALNALLLARTFYGERWRLIAWANNFLHLWVLPAAPLMVLAGLLRKWRLALLLMPLAQFAVRLYRPYFVGQPAPVLPHYSRQFRILTFNLQGKSSAGITAVIRAANADIVALQELSEAGANRICEDLIAEYPYMLLHPKDGADYYAGMGLLSKHPVVSDVYREVGLGQQRVELVVEGAPLVYYNIHVDVPFSGRDASGELHRTAHVRAFLEWAIKDNNAPVLISGDFNMTELTDDYKRVTQVYTDAFQAVGWGFGFTFPAWEHYADLRRFIPPLARLDHIFINERLLVLEVRVWPDSGDADHRPLLAEMAFRE